MKIFVNLAVSDLDASKEFWNKLGFTFNPQFTDAKAACLVFTEDIYAMLLTHEFFKTFTDKEIIDAPKSIEAINALSLDTKEQVDEMLSKALAAGATEPKPAQDHGFMYSRAFSDLDGHTWEFFWMDVNAAPAQQ